MDDARLIRAVRGGDRNAYGRLVECHKARIFRLCYRIAGNATDAEDLAHEAFVEAYVKLGQLRDEARFGPWLRTVALNICRRWYGHRSRSLREEPLADDTPCEAVSSEKPEEPDLRLHHGLAQLSAPHRLCLVLHYGEELSYEEVATFLGVPIGTVMSRLHRAKRQLKSIMECLTEEDALPEPGDAFEREVETEIAALLALYPTDPDARERLSVILTRSPERFVALIASATENTPPPGTDKRERQDSQFLSPSRMGGGAPACGSGGLGAEGGLHIALLLRRLGGDGMRVVLECRFGRDRNLRENAAAILTQFVAQARPGQDGTRPSRTAARGIYRLLEALIASPAAQADKAQLCLDLLDTSQDAASATLLMAALLAHGLEADTAVLAEFDSVASPAELLRRADLLHCLCRTGAAFGQALLTAFDDSGQRALVALTGTEALARSFRTPPDDDRPYDLARSHRFSRSWALPRRTPGDEAILRQLAREK